MTEEDLPLRDKDLAVIHKIHDGDDDTYEITSTTTLENHEVYYCFDKLETLGLITVERRDGMVERIDDGQLRVFQAPNRARLTERGREVLSQRVETVDQFDEMSHAELVERVRSLEQQVQELQKTISQFRKHVQKKLKQIQEKL